MRRSVVRVCVAAGIFYAVSAGNVVAEDSATPNSMRFEWRLEGPAERCGNHCRTWISAVGPIADATVRDFEAFAKASDVRGATLVLDSEGGSVLATIAMGRVIRQLGMTTSVGRTKMLPSLDGAPPRATLSPDAICESMCAFILLSGVRRHVPPQARVLVHQIWIGSKSKDARDFNYSAEELRVVERDIGSLARYTVEMGGDIELIETTLGIPPWEPLYQLSANDLRRMRMTTEDGFDPQIFAGRKPGPLPGTSTTSAQALRPRPIQ